MVDGTSSSLDSYGYTIDKDSGALTRRISGLAAPFLPGRRNVHVIGVCGRSTIQANIIEAGMELVRVNWQTQLGGTRPGYGGTSSNPNGETAGPGQFVLGYFVPNRVMELLQPNAAGPGIA